MSGKFEEFLDGLAARWLPKIPWLAQLSDRSERMVMGNHICSHALVVMLFNTVSLLLGHKIIALLGLIISSGWMVKAELNRDGRRIDWITRSMGVFVGAIPLFFILWR